MQRPASFGQPSLEGDQLQKAGPGLGLSPVLLVAVPLPALALALAVGGVAGVVVAV